jgi:hypothetical protein
MCLVAASLLLAGCTVLHSSTYEEDGGIPYYLPKSIIVAKVDAQRRLKPGREKKQDKIDSDYDYFVSFNTNTETVGRAQLKATRGETVPDLNHRFRLTYNANPFFKDRYCILTSESNLLQSIEYATEDATPRIALALAELARKAGAFSRREDEEAKPPEDAPLVDYGTVIVTFDPFSDRERQAAEQVINRTFGYNVNVRFDFPDLRQFRPSREKCRGDRGVCFRTKVQTPMLLRSANDGAKVKGEALTTIVLVDVVNPHFIGHFDLDRAFMVEKIVRLGFEEGALTHVIMRKPSEVLQTVKLPVAIVDTILAVPANFIANTAGGATNVNTELQTQRQTINRIEQKLTESGVLQDNAANANIYRERCEGRQFNPKG